MPDRGSVKVFQAPSSTFKGDNIFGPLESFKRAHSAFSNGGFSHTMICAELFQNVSSSMNEGTSTPHKPTKKKHKGRVQPDIKVPGSLLEPIDEEDMYGEETKRSRETSRRLFHSIDVDGSNPIEAIKRESLRVRRSRLEEDILKLRKRLQLELDVRQALENSLSDACQTVPEHLPSKVRELLGDISTLELTVLGLEEELLAYQWQLYHETRERLTVQNNVQFSRPFRETTPPTPPPPPPSCQEKLLHSLQALHLHEDSFPFSPTTPDTGVRRSVSQSGRYSDTESVELSTSADNLALAILSQPGCSRRPGHWSNCSEEEFEDVTRTSFSEEGERPRHRKHQRKKSRQNHLELAAGSPSPEEMSEACSTSRRVSRLVLKGLALHPNKLSEKMVRCMMDIYCHLSDTAPATATSSPTSPFTQAVTSSSVSSLSDSSFLSLGRSPLVELAHKDVVQGSESLFDPYRTKEKLSWVDIGVYSSAMEIRWISVGKEQLGYAAQALQEYKLLVEQLAKVDILSMAHEEKLAFWINIYNSLLMHGYLAYGIPKSEIKSFFLMQKASYVVGGHAFTALAIEYHLLKHKAPAHRPQFALLLALHKTKLTSEQSKLSIDYPEPLTVFALSCGARSSPLVKVYSPRNVVQLLKSSLHDYIRSSVGLGVRGKLVIPKLLYVYAHESMDDSSLLGWIFLHLPTSQVEVIQECIQQRKYRFLGSRNFAILPFDFRFQYLFLNT